MKFAPYQNHSLLTNCPLQSVKLIAPDGPAFFLDVSIPSGAGPHPCVIDLSGGLGGIHGAFGENGPQLYDKCDLNLELWKSLKYAVVTINHRGTPFTDKNYLALADFAGSEINDIVHSINFIRDQLADLIDPAKIVIVGQSAGGLRGLKTAERVDGLCGCIAYETPGELKSYFDWQRTEFGDRAEIFAIGKLQKRWQTQEEMLEQLLPRQVTKPKCPLHFIGSDSNHPGRLVPIESYRQLERSLRNSGHNITSTTISNLLHVRLDPKAPPETPLGEAWISVLESLSRFFSKER